MNSCFDAIRYFKKELMQGSYFVLEITSDKEDVLEFKHANRDKFLIEAQKMITDFMSNSIKCTYTRPNDGVKNTTIRLYSY